MENIIFFLIEQNKLPQSILIEGKNSSNLFHKSLNIAEKILSQRLNFNNESMENLFFHPDLKVITPDKSIKIEQIKLLNEFCYLTPHKSKNKVIIIKDAEKMTTEASNALLKILEEPLDNRFFLILAKNKYKLLPTIISRCIPFKIKPDIKETVDINCDNAQIIKEIEEIFIKINIENFSFFFLNNFFISNIEKNFDNFEDFLKAIIQINLTILENSENYENFRVNIIETILNILKILKSNLNYKNLIALFSLYLKEKKFNKGVINFG